MKTNLSFKFDSAAVLAWLARSQRYLVGLALIGIFGYTAYVVNAALNVTAADVPVKGTGITFDKATLESLKTLTNVPVDTTLPSLGKNDPFGNN